MPRSARDAESDADANSGRKGSRTRERVVREAAELFNLRGFAGTSVIDVATAAGLEKGGVYNHFGSKDELALAAFAYAASLVRERLLAAARAHPAGADRIATMLAVYRTLGSQPFLPGGCPILNTAVDADDTHPALREVVRAAMTDWLTLVARSLEAGRADGTFRADIDVAAASATIVAGLEGGILLAKLYADAGRLRAVVDQLGVYLDALRALPARA